MIKKKENQEKEENKVLVDFFHKFDSNVDISNLNDHDIEQINKIPLTKALYEKIINQTNELKERDKLVKDTTQKCAEILNNTLLVERRLHNNMNNEIKHQKVSIFSDIIDVMDLISITHDSMEKNISVSSIKNGLEMILSKIKKFFDKFDIKELDVKLGDKYDCKFHEAISAEEDDRFSDENIIIKIVKPGFFLNEHLIRPALVIVSKRR